MPTATQTNQDLHQELTAATRTACGGWIRSWFHDCLSPTAIATGRHNGNTYRVMVSWMSGDWTWRVTCNGERVAANLRGETTAEDAATQALLAYSRHAADNSRILSRPCGTCGMRHCICPGVA